MRKTSDVRLPSGRSAPGRSRLPLGRFWSDLDRLKALETLSTLAAPLRKKSLQKPLVFPLRRARSNTCGASHLTMVSGPGRTRHSHPASERLEPSRDLPRVRSRCALRRSRSRSVSDRFRRRISHRRSATAKHEPRVKVFGLAARKLLRRFACQLYSCARYPRSTESSPRARSRIE